MTTGNEMEVRNTRITFLRVGLWRIHAMGSASTGVTEILDAADLPKVSSYHHFASKEAFVKEATVHMQRQRTSRENLSRRQNRTPHALAALLRGTHRCLRPGGQYQWVHRGDS